uniref:Uncharacterized protein n=1 Tax=Solanum tuberosum TaxID=4113 RepID=M1D858_SOLTU
MNRRRANASGIEENNVNEKAPQLNQGPLVPQVPNDAGAMSNVKIRSLCYFDVNLKYGFTPKGEMGKLEPKREGHYLPSLRGSSRPVVATGSRGATVVGEAVCPKNCPSQGYPSRANSRIVVKTTNRGKTRGVALASWGHVSLREVTGQGTTGTTTDHVALDGSCSRA